MLKIQSILLTEERYQFDNGRSKGIKILISLEDYFRRKAWLIVFRKNAALNEY